jgi:hypothetical protein
MREKFMKKCVLFTAMILLVLTAGIGAQTQIPSKSEILNYPEVPRISAYEAYVKYKEGKAIILHGGGEAYSKRHIIQAFNLEKYNDEILQRFPKQGIEIFTYCY